MAPVILTFVHYLYRKSPTDTPTQTESFRNIPLLTIPIYFSLWQNEIKKTKSKNENRKSKNENRNFFQRLRTSRFLLPEGLLNGLNLGGKMRSWNIFCLFLLVSFKKKFLFFRKKIQTKTNYHNVSQISQPFIAYFNSICLIIIQLKFTPATCLAPTLRVLSTTCVTSSKSRRTLSFWQ